MFVSPGYGIAPATEGVADSQWIVKMSMLMVRESGELWLLGKFCRSEYVKRYLVGADEANHAVFDSGPCLSPDWWMTYTRPHDMTWCICIASDRRVSSLAPANESEKRALLRRQSPQNTGWRHGAGPTARHAASDFASDRASEFARNLL
jgi:hypothetical protein